MLIKYSLPLNPQKASRFFQTDADTIVIGRNRFPGKQIDVSLARDDYVSEVHARISFEKGRYWVVDLGSKDGTFVNGREVTAKTRIATGDKIQVGGTIIEIDMEWTPGVETTQPMETGMGDKVVPMDSGEDGTGDFGPDDTTVANSTDFRHHMRVLPRRMDTGESNNRVMDRLGAATKLSRSFWTAGTFDALSNILEEGLKKVIPAAERGGILLADKKGRLHLRAHWPRIQPEVSTTWAHRVFESGQAFLWAAPDENVSLVDPANNTVHRNIPSGVYAPLTLGREVIGVIYVDTLRPGSMFSNTDLELLKMLAGHVTHFIMDRILSTEGWRENELITDLSGQFPPKKIGWMMKHGHRRHVRGERIDPVTILVSNIDNFTTLSWGMDPREVVGMLNEMFNRYVPIIFYYDGILENFMGDSVLAVFGNPDPAGSQWEKAVKAAIDIQRATGMIREDRRNRRLPVFDVGIGIHTGAVIHGFMGTEDRMAYAVIGDTVNRAFQYCEGANTGEVVISKDVYEKVRSHVKTRSRIIRSRHPGKEADLEGYVVEGLRKEGLREEGVEGSG